MDKHIQQQQDEEKEEYHQKAANFFKKEETKQQWQENKKYSSKEYNDSNSFDIENIIKRYEKTRNTIAISCISFAYVHCLIY